MSVQIQIGADATQFDSVVQSLPAKVDAASKNMASKTSPLARSMGGVAMQVQDIAVQLQMGARGSTVLAQQGSQILSAFGAGGAIAGGVLAIGGAFLAMGQASREGFEKAAAAHADFLRQFQNGLLGSSEEVAATTQKISEQFGRLSETMANMWQNRSVSDVIAERFGGATFEEKWNQTAYQMEDLKALIAKGDAETINRAAQELQIIEAQLAGEKEKAAVMQLSLNLMREQEKINNSDLSPAAKKSALRLAEAKNALGLRNLIDDKMSAPEKPKSLLADLFENGGEKMAQRAGAIMDGIAPRLKEMANQSASRLRSFAGAIGMLKGDMDTSSGRGVFNPLRGDGSRQLSEMARQTAALQKAASSADKHTSLLQSIDGAIRSLNLAPRYS